MPGVLSRLLHYALPITILVFGFGGLFFLKSLRAKPESNAPDKQAPLVETVPLRAHDDGLVFETDGQVVPYREVILAAEVAGRVQTKWPDCETGRFVTKGSPLIQIDPSDYAIEVRRISELSRQADLSLDELVVERLNTGEMIELAESELELSQKERRRQESLVQQRAGSEKEHDTARRGLLVAQNALQRLKKERSLLDVRESRLKSEKKRLVAELEKAQLNVRRTKIVAPMDGIITEDSVEEDGYVTPGSMLAGMEDVSKVEVRFNLRMDELQWFWRHANVNKPGTDVETGRSYHLPNLPVTVSYQVEGQTYNWLGHLSRYDGAAVNSATRTVPCIVEVADPRQTQKESDGTTVSLAAPPALMRGMFVSVRLRVPLKDPLLAAPEAAIRPGKKLWIVRDVKLHVETVTVVQLFADQALLAPAGSDLSPGTVVIVSPLPLAVDGMDVRLADAEPKVAGTSDVERKGAGG
ncbi:MAG TPA: HlyD family efflux transporter periplasmic adaptor subunit [Pirellulales bacterium]|nr:HlyD family efflux transporter periplasmic adaptor subunit [Pirellulales bacterium]